MNKNKNKNKETKDIHYVGTNKLYASIPFADNDGVTFLSFIRLENGDVEIHMDSCQAIIKNKDFKELTRAVYTLMMKKISSVRNED